MMDDYAALKRLAMAVVVKAAEDYAEVCFNTVKWKDREWGRNRQLEDCENFFRSPYFTVLTEDAMDGEALMAIIKKRRRDGWTPRHLHKKLMEVIEE